MVDATGTPEAATTTPAPVTVAEGTPVGDLLAQIQAADKSAQEPVAPETSEPEVTAEAAPEAAEAEPAAAEEKAEAEGEEAAPAEGEKAETPEQIAESIRSLIKKSNLPPERKDELAGLAYEGLQLRKMGFDFQQAKFLKEMGVTPETIVERVKIHGTLDDAKTDAMYAQDMRELINDLTTQPEVAARKLHATSPETFSVMASEIVDHFDEILPEKAVQFRQSATRNALMRAAADVQENEELSTAYNMVIDHLFQGQAASAGPNPNDPTQVELAQLKARLAREEQAKRDNLTRAQQTFGTELQNRGAQAIFADIRAMVDAQKPAGLDNDLAERIAGDAFNGVANDLLANENFRKDIERFVAGSPTGQNFNAAIEFVRTQAKVRAPIHLRDALARWGKYAVQQSANKQAVQQKAAKPDVGKVAGPATPAAGTPIHEQVLAAGKSKNLTVLEMIQMHDQLKAAGGQRR